MKNCSQFACRDSHVNLCSSAFKLCKVFGIFWHFRNFEGSPRSRRRVKVKVKNVANLSDKTFHHFFIIKVDHQIWPLERASEIPHKFSRQAFTVKRGTITTAFICFRANGAVFNYFLGESLALLDLWYSRKGFYCGKSSAHSHD